MTHGADAGGLVEGRGFPSFRRPNSPPGVRCNARVTPDGYVEGILVWREVN
jgi:hypothetical protein